MAQTHELGASCRAISGEQGNLRRVSSSVCWAGLPERGVSWYHRAENRTAFAESFSSSNVAPPPPSPTSPGNRRILAQRSRSASALQSTSPTRTRTRNPLPRPPARLMMGGKRLPKPLSASPPHRPAFSSTSAGHTTAGSSVRGRCHGQSPALMPRPKNEDCGTCQPPVHTLSLIGLSFPSTFGDPHRHHTAPARHRPRTAAAPSRTTPTVTVTTQPSPAPSPAPSPRHRHRQSKGSHTTPAPHQHPGLHALRQPCIPVPCPVHADDRNACLR